MSEVTGIRWYSGNGGFLLHNILILTFFLMLNMDHYSFTTTPNAVVRFERSLSNDCADDGEEQANIFRVRVSSIHRRMS